MEAEEKEDRPPAAAPLSASAASPAPETPRRPPPKPGSVLSPEAADRRPSPLTASGLRSRRRHLLLLPSRAWPMSQRRAADALGSHSRAGGTEPRRREAARGGDNRLPCAVRAGLPRKGAGPGERMPAGRFLPAPTPPPLGCFQGKGRPAWLGRGEKPASFGYGTSAAPGRPPYSRGTPQASCLASEAAGHRLLPGWVFAAACLGCPALLSSPPNVALGCSC